MKVTLDFEVAEINHMIQKGIVFKNNPPFWLWMSTINNIFIGHAEDLSIAIPMYNLL